MNAELLVGFAGDQKSALADVLNRLIPCLDLQTSYFVGGIATSYHLAKAQRPAAHRSFRDIDVCVTQLDGTLSRLRQQFELVDLQHELGGGYSFFAKFLDKQQDIKIDIFDNTFPAKEPEEVQFGDWKVKIRNAEDQLVKTVFDLQEVLGEGPIDTTPKQFEDARALWEIVDRQKAQNYWSENGKSHPLFKGMPENIEEAMVRAEKYVQEHPEVLGSN